MYVCVCVCVCVCLTVIFQSNIHNEGAMYATIHPTNAYIAFPGFHLENFPSVCVFFFLFLVCVCGGVVSECYKYGIL